MPQLASIDALRVEYNAEVQKWNRDIWHIAGAPDDVWASALANEPPSTFEAWLEKRGKEMQRRVTSTRADDLRTQALALLEQADRIEAVKQTEPQENDTVISWDVPCGTNGRKRTFVAIRAGNRWWTTAVNQPNSGYNWHQLCEIWPQLAEGDFHYVSKWSYYGGGK